MEAAWINHALMIRVIMFLIIQCGSNEWVTWIWNCIIIYLYLSLSLKPTIWSLKKIKCLNSLCLWVVFYVLVANKVTSVICLLCCWSELNFGRIYQPVKLAWSNSWQSYCSNMIGDIYLYHVQIRQVVFFRNCVVIGWKLSGGLGWSKKVYVRLHKFTYCRGKL